MQVHTHAQCHVDEKRERDLIVRSNATCFIVLCSECARVLDPAASLVDAAHVPVVCGHAPID